MKQEIIFEKLIILFAGILFLISLISPVFNINGVGDLIKEDTDSTTKSSITFKDGKITFFKIASPGSFTERIAITYVQNDDGKTLDGDFPIIYFPCIGLFITVICLFLLYVLFFIPLKKIDMKFQYIKHFVFAGLIIAIIIIMAYYLIDLKEEYLKVIVSSFNHTDSLTVVFSTMILMTIIFQMIAVYCSIDLGIKYIRFNRELIVKKQSTRKKNNQKTNAIVK